MALLLHRRLLLLGIVCAVFGAVASSVTSPTAPDALLFADAAEQLLTSSGLDVFADHRLQVGPVYLVLLAPLVALSDLLGIPPVPVIAAGLSGATAVVLALFLRRLHKQEAPVLELGLGLSVVAGTPLYVVAMSGHFEELATVLLLVAAGLSMRCGKGTLAALLIGLAAGCKLWGLLGVPVLLLDGAPLLTAYRVQVLRAARAGLATAAVALTYAPFILFAHVATFEHSWLVGYPSPFALLAHGVDFTFQLRLLQGVLAVGVGVVLATGERSTLASRVWTVPAGVCLSRLLVDPFIQSYYLAIGLWSHAEHGLAEVKLAVVATAVAPLVLGAVLVSEGRIGALFCSAVFVSGVLGLWQVRRVMPALARRL